MKNGTKAWILVLECFLVMGVDEGIKIEKKVKKAAEKAAFLWRKRLISEGGLRKSYDMDVKALLLLIGCFGIPRGFTNVDIMDFLLPSLFKKNMNGALTRSNVLMAKNNYFLYIFLKVNTLTITGFSYIGTIVPSVLGTDFLGFSTALAAVVITFSSNLTTIADLNKFEADTGGEFGITSTTKFGSADLKRVNFTSADMRESDFNSSTFNSAYLKKAVAYKANFSVELAPQLDNSCLSAPVPSYPKLVYLLTIFAPKLRVSSLVGVSNIIKLRVKPFSEGAKLSGYSISVSMCTVSSWK
ncbi:Thylakoid lumenal protein, chloroplastic [Capsicum chinense]|nr:Thylakoid lumenal protein, chloroplastic [Capsicum chinense]